MLVLLSLITLKGVEVEVSPAKAQPVVKEKARGTIAASSAVSKATSRDAVPRPETDAVPVQVAVELSGEAGYVPFAAGDGWVHNEILDPFYAHTDDGMDTWLEMKTDGTGALWAVYTGTDNIYLNDTIYVFCSLDGGVTWQYRVAIYSATTGYHPYVARLSVDRVNNWVYICNVLGSEAGGGSYYPGTMWVTRFQHTGGGNITNLQTIQVDPMGWGDIYGKCAVAADGSGNGYVYLLGIDWTAGWADYYRSSDNGATWTYIESVDMGNAYTDVVSACPVYNGQGALLTFVDWGDTDSLYYVYYSHVTSTSDDWFYFSGRNGFVGLYGPAAMGSLLTMPFEEEYGPSDFDTYYYLSSDGGSTWYIYTWDNSTWDRRSLTFDVTPEGPNGWRIYASYWDDSTEGNGSYNDGLGSPYLWYTEDGGTWHNWNLNWFYADPQVYPGEPMRVNPSEHWEITCPAPALFNGTWVPHVAWRRTEGATNGGDPWHSFPYEPLGVSEGSERPGVWFDGVSLIVKGYEGTLKLYDPAGKLVGSWEVKGEAKLKPNLKPGVYLWRAGRWGGALVK